MDDWGFLDAMDDENLAGLMKSKMALAREASACAEECLARLMKRAGGEDA